MCQQQVCTSPMEQQLTNSPRPATRQRMECWAPTSSQRTVTPSLPMEGGIKSDSILPLNSADLSTTMYEDFAFDMAEFVNKSRPTSLLQSDERYHISFPNNCHFSRVQQQVCPASIEQQSANSPRPATRQRMECWSPTNSHRIVTEPLTLAPSLPIEGKIKSDGMLPLNSADLSAPTYEDFSFDMTELVNKSRQSTSLLHMAVAGNHVDTIKVLLQDERVRIDDKDSDGFTPLQRAVMHGRSEIVKLLLAHSADTGPVRAGDLRLGAVGGFGANFSGS
jgi:hypothetical protein